MHGMVFRPFREFIANWAAKIHERREQNGKIAGFRSPVEWFNELINCAQCTGFWCGLFCGLIIVWSDAFTPDSGRHSDQQVIHLILMWFACGLGGSFLAMLGKYLIDLLFNLNDLIYYRKMIALRQLEEPGEMSKETGE